MSELLIIAGKDFTKNISLGSWKVNEFPVYSEWEDYAKIKHKHHHRDRVSGSFKLFFNKVEEWEEFLRIINENTNKAGYIQAQVFINNKNIFTDPKYFFIEFDPSNYKPHMKFGKSYDGIDITIEER